MSPTTLNLHIESLPDLIDQLNPKLASRSFQIATKLQLSSIERLVLTGCGDSHNAAVCSSHFFSSITGISCSAFPAMESARYQTQQIARSNPGSTLVVAISASGRIGRTIEALSLAKKAGAITIAVTGNVNSPLGMIGEFALSAETPQMRESDTDIATPGSRSFIASLLALYHLAISLAESAAAISLSEAESLRGQIRDLAEPVRKTIEINFSKCLDLAAHLSEANQYVYCGSGPNWGTSMYSAAKLLEASGDLAIAYDLEEWSHLEYFARVKDTPTFIISAGQNDLGRALEIAKAARTIGRRVIMVSPLDSELDMSDDNEYRLPLIGSFREYLSPVVSCIPGLLFAAARAELISERYFRGFGGGRSPEEGGGISRIQSSSLIDQIPD